MDDQTKHGLSTVSGADLAIGVQFTAQVGPNRQIVLTTAVPLDWSATEINETLDKLVGLVDRRNAFSMLDVARAELERARHEVATQLEQKAQTEVRWALEWEVSNRKGPFRPTDSQRAQLANFDKTAKNLREVVLPKLQKQLAELEAKTRSAGDASERSADM